MQFDNSYAALPHSFHASVAPDAVDAPSLLAWNHALAVELGLDALGSESQRARIFSGGTTLPGSEPIAMAYAGHQFGNFVPQLGDGRAVLLGELLSESGERFDLQLKGSGRTPFSRGGDGKSWLGPVLREYILSEAMHRLGVPTTRALAAVATGETVLRETPLPGAVFTRVASSHLRVGTFEFFAVRRDLASLQTLADYAIDRHCPDAKQAASPYVAFFEHVVLQQARLIAHWMSVGFIHGVMNTDNTAISGETIDYGPAANLDEFRFDKVFSSIDGYGRYAYANQPEIAQWNLARLAETLMLIGAERDALEAALNGFGEHYGDHYLALMAPKLGLFEAHEDDSGLVVAWLEHLNDNALDYTLSHRALAARIDADDEPQFGSFEAQWRQRISSQGKTSEVIAELMMSVNPLFIARNHFVERAINDALEGDLGTFNDLNTVLADPFVEHPSLAGYADAPAPNERVTRTFCGT